MPMGSRSRASVADADPSLSSTTNMATASVISVTSNSLLSNNSAAVAAASSAAPPPPSTSPSPSLRGSPMGRLPNQPKLRRKAPIADTLHELTAVQRLVEYFCVVTSEPQWQEKDININKSHDEEDDDDSHGNNTNAVHTDIDSSDDAAGGFGRRRGVGVRRPRLPSFRRNRNNNHRQQHNHHQKHVYDLSSSSSTMESRQTTSSEGSDTLKNQQQAPLPLPQQQPPPQQGTAGNIHMPNSGGGLLQPGQVDYNFRPKITARYPLTDHEDNPFNPMILQFCYPSGVDVIAPSKSYEMPRVHHFVLTNERGRKVYGTCLTIFEEYVPKKGTNDPWSRRSMTHEDDSKYDQVEVCVIDNDNPTNNNSPTATRTQQLKPHTNALYIPKVLCLLSTWPYLTAFREYLAQMYRLATATNIMSAPIERYIVNLCCEIPAPPPGSHEVCLTILDSTIRFWAPPAKLPIAYVALPFQILFECLDLENVLIIWSAMIMERKVLLLSSQYSILTVCSEILCSLLFPLRWSHLYVPLLPRMLCPMLDAPVPYLCGIVRENYMYAQMFISGDTIVVDLDHNNVKMGSHVVPVPALPQKKWTKLQTALTETAGHVYWRARGLERDYRAMMNKKLQKRNFEKLRQVVQCNAGWTEKLAGLDHAFNLAYTPDSPHLLNDTLPEDERNMWERVQEVFLRFFVALLKDYRKYLDIPKTTSNYNNNTKVHHHHGATAAAPFKPTFDRIAFLAAQKAERADFLVELCMTQQFDDFLTRRMYSPGEPDLVFFDQSIDAKLNRSKLKLRKVDTPFLLNAKVHKDLKKIKAIEPNGDGLKEYDHEAVLKLYVYKKWPDLFDATLFSEPRPIPKMIAAEFDRQTILVNKLRANFVDEAAGGDDESILDFYGGDYDTSPEVASFTVFFFVYSSLVGRDWQNYQIKRRLIEEREKQNSKAGTVAESSPVSTERGEGAAEFNIETMLPNFDSPTDRVAMDGCVSDLSMGLCDACPEETLLTLKSVIVLCGDGAHDICTAMFEKTAAKQVVEMSRSGSPTQFWPLENSGNQLVDPGVMAEYEEAREVASAQLDLAFEMLSTMSLRQLSADSDAYLSLMEACGRCGDTQRALNLMELMRHDGFVADSEVLSCFVSAFAHVDSGGIDIGATADASATTSPNNNQNHGDNETPPQTDTKNDSDAYSTYLKKNFVAAKEANKSPLDFSALHLWAKPENLAPVTEDDTADMLSEYSGASTAGFSGGTAPTGGSVFLDWFAQHQETNSSRKKQRRRKRKKNHATSAAGLKVTEMVSRQLSLGESLLDYLYPDLAIDTDSDSCPHCSNILSESDIVAGWSPCAFQDFTTMCPKCEHRFVPRFAVTSSSPEFVGSQGPQTPLYCEFLSPWVVRKELQHIIKGEVGIKGMLEPSWRSGADIQSTLFWNLMVLCRRYRLPFTFLLQGSFKNNRLILPRMPAEM